MNDLSRQNSRVPEKKRILAVMSDPAWLDFVRESLGEEYAPEAVSGGAEARRLLAEEGDDIRLLIMDASLPDLPGLDLLRWMSEDPQYSQIPVIVTGEGGEEPEALRLGAVDYIRKSGGSAETVRTRARRAVGYAETRSRIYFSEHDPLTGLYNTESFFRTARELDRELGDADMDAVVLDISHFTLLKDRYGKQYGNDILRSIGRRVLESVEKYDGIACRRDADIFLIYGPHREDTREILDFVYAGLDDRVRLRAGIYPGVDKSVDVEQRFDRAKFACDNGRDNPRRSIQIYDERLQGEEMYREQLLEDFPNAIAQHQFVVYYQPKFAIQGNMPMMSSSEALVRWRHPKLGMISPGVFIPLFEKNGLIRQLDDYVWREAARQMREWKDRLHFCLPVSVNVSRLDVFDPNLTDRMLKLVREFDLDPGEFLLEITESAYTQDSRQIIHTVNELRAAGFKIEIDDFGSGYSSLSMISSMPIDALKLDMEFMHSSFTERKNTRMLSAVIDIAYSLDVPTVAEGVETAEQLFILREMGCEYVQGYYFSRPVPAEAYEEMLIERSKGGTGIPAPDRNSSIKPAEQFAYEALHDPVTQLYNFSAYRMLLRDADQRNIALLLVDVDNYDGIFRDGGEDTANRVLRAVAEVLRRNFRSVDFVCHIGRNEFAVIMTRVNSSLRDLVAEKVERINSRVIERCRDLANVELSFGVAFADREGPQGDIFHDADLALRRMKDTGEIERAIY